MKVIIPSPLLSYTRAREVEATGATLAELVADLDRQYPGIRFRMIDEQGQLRQHVRFFVGSTQARALDVALSPSDEITILQALSGG
jgi:molybdopterin converting factor small subunit